MPEALVINDVSYAGDVASYMYTRAVVGMDTFNKGCVYVEDGIKKTRTIPRIEVSDFMQKRKATPVSKGTVTVDGKTITPRDLMLYYEFNPRDFEVHWYAEQQSPQLLDRELPQTIETFMMLMTMLRLNEFFENHTWRGRIDYDVDGTALDPTTKGADAADAQYFYFDGLIYKLLSDNTTILATTPGILVSGTAGAGEENIGAAFNRILKLVPKALLNRYGIKGLKFMVNYATKLVYDEYLTTSTTFKNNDTTERSIDRYKGYDVVPLAGMPDNTIVACIACPDTSSNLWVGMNSTEDENNLMLSKLQANSELYFIKGLFKIDTQTGFPDQIVLYTSIVA